MSPHAGTLLNIIVKHKYAVNAALSGMMQSAIFVEALYELCEANLVVLDEDARYRATRAGRAWVALTSPLTPPAEPSARR